jgi:hypothetical protein
MRVENITSYNKSNVEKKSINNQYYNTKVKYDSVSFSGKFNKYSKGFLEQLKDMVYEKVSSMGKQIKQSNNTESVVKKAEGKVANIIEQVQLPFSRKNVNISLTRSSEEELLNFSTNTKVVKDYRPLCHSKDVQVFYEKSSDVTAIHIPYDGKSITIQIDGQLSKEDAINLVKYINLQGFPDERYFLDGAVKYLNEKPIVKYSTNNIGMEYDFHDSGSEFYFPARKWACDTRLFHQPFDSNAPCVKCVYTKDDKSRLTTVVSRFIPNNRSRFGADWYSLFIDGIIPEEQASKLVEFIEASIGKKNIIPDKSDLPDILQATINFLNK